MMKSMLVLFFLGLASITRGDDAYVKKFAYTQVLSSCLGEEAYYGWVQKVIAAKKQCHSEPAKLPTAKRGVQRREEPVANLGSQRREALFEGPYLKQLLAEVISKTSNFTCVLQKMNYVDEDLRILPEVMKNEVKNLTTSATLNADFVKIIDQCNQFSLCLPEEPSPLPIDVKRLLVFVKCEKKLRMAICMKQHILRNMDHFDVSGIQSEGSSDQEKLAEKILHILWGSEEKEDFEIY